MQSNCKGDGLSDHAASSFPDPNGEDYCGQEGCPSLLSGTQWAWEPRGGGGGVKRYRRKGRGGRLKEQLSTAERWGLRSWWEMSKMKGFWGGKDERNNFHLSFTLKLKSARVVLMSQKTGLLEYVKLNLLIYCQNDRCQRMLQIKKEGV